ncbi:MAG: hypothetical protein WCP97_05255 [bacterium]
MKKCIPLCYIMAFLLTGCQFINPKSNDPNLVKIPTLIEAFHTCMNTKTSKECYDFIAQDDNVIASTDIVRKVLPELPLYTRQFSSIEWDTAKEEKSPSKEEKLYTISGKATLTTNEQMLLTYKIIEQNTTLKIYTLSFEDASAQNETPELNQ